MQIVRILLAGFLFSLFGLICLVGNIVFLPIIILRLNKFKFFENLARDLVYLSWNFFIFSTKILGYLDYEFENFNKLGKASQLVIANHPSLLDVVFILSKVKRINCIVKNDLSKNIFLSPAIKASNYILNTKDEYLLNRSLEVLKNGESLLVFPEGTRTKEIIKFHKAPFYIAIHGARVITPIFIYMNPRSLQKGAKWYQTPKTKIKYKIKINKNLEISEFLHDKPNSIRVKALYQTMNEIYKKEIIC
ncbi:1-acyl-sn-glycerol-3-phosphate acyltransferase [Helicobacter sp. MIT 99-5507]|uniref:lysophospholipid acyltransferase family protein n=1 Tax=Helicobacter sp. MIT 99-5507 TaxID=152489 RepID=UPI000E1F3D03|nr:lysophospholipid acyltransferase family protein [Helicobacter sp. MIT 99-5507]RDU56719.1 1-acyl-sn-glycerol-3-phosphate acyltransferase [Helicobacter sp. MIT 99-5507]